MAKQKRGRPRKNPGRPKKNPKSTNSLPKLKAHISSPANFPPDPSRSIPNLSEGYQSNNSNKSFVKGSHPESRANIKTCPNCMKSFRKRKEFHHHLRTHLEYESFECHVCLESFSREEGLGAHMQMHKSTVLYACEECPETFSHYFALNRHKLEHADGPPYICPICSAPFSSVNNRSLHVKNHVLRCPLCGVNFRSNKEHLHHIFNEHKRKVDKNAGLQKIPALSNWKDLLENVDGSREDGSCDYYDSGEDVDNGGGNRTEEWAENKCCFICEKVFISEATLEKHMQGHRYYKCNLCPKFFGSEEHLQNHSEKKHWHLPEVGQTGLAVMFPFNRPERLEGQQRQATTVIVNEIMSVQQSKVEVGTGSLNRPDFRNTSSGVEDFELGNEFNITWLLGFADKCKILTLPLEGKIVDKIIYLQKLISESLSHVSDSLGNKKNCQLLLRIYNDFSNVLNANFKFGLDNRP